MQIPDRIHFFSYATGVSLELPAGFLEGDASASGVVYADHDDTAGRDRAVVIVAPAAGAPSDDAAGIAVDALAAAGDVLDKSVRTIDDETVAVARLRFSEGLPHSAPGVGESGSPDGGGLLTQDIAVTFAALVFNDRLMTITAIAPWSEADQWWSVFDEAIDSCRFLMTEAGA